MELENGRLIFDRASLTVLVQPLVYVYWNGPTCLYVGMGQNAARPLGVRNHHLGHEFIEASELHVYPCESIEDARRKETELIAQFQPVHNISKTDRIKSIARKKPRPRVQGVSLTPGLAAMLPKRPRKPSKRPCVLSDAHIEWIRAGKYRTRPSFNYANQSSVSV